MFGFRRAKRRRWSGDDALMRVPGDLPFRRTYLWRRLRQALTARLVPFLVFVGLLGLGYHFFESGDFAVRRVDVVGASRTSVEQINAAAALERTSLFEVNRMTVRDAVRRTRSVQDVAVSLVWPNTVRLAVVEHRPAFTWEAGATRFLVTEDGLVLGPASSSDDPSVLVVDTDNQPVAVGDRLDPDVLATARFLRNALPAAMGVTPTHFEYSSTFGIVLPTERGYRVAFGVGEDLARKVIALRAIAERIAAHEASPELVDLRVVDRPYYR